MKDIDKLGWCHTRNGKLLVARSHGKNMFYIPGGKRENGETDQEALIREIKEEISVDLIPEKLQYFGTFKDQAHGKPQGVHVVTTCYFGDFTGELKANAEIEEITWLSYQEKERCSSVTQIIMEKLKTTGRL